MQAADLAYYFLRFLTTAAILRKVYRFISLSVGPERLRLPPLIVPYDSICRIQDILRAAVILFQFYYLCSMENILKIEDVHNIGAAELIDGLIVITNHTDIFPLPCKQADQLKLRIVGILILIHADVAETVLIIFKDLGAGLEQMHGHTDQIIKIQRIILKQCLLIFGICFNKAFLPKVMLIYLRVFLWPYQLILRIRYLTQDRSFLDLLGIKLKLFEYSLHYGFRIIRIIYGKAVVVAYLVYMPAQYAHAG